MAKLVAVTGGIGSGKSVISKVLRSLGYEVFDCDIEAKRIMDCNAKIKQRISSEIDTRAIEHGNINRKVLSEIVFNDKEKLSVLNEIVHGAVKDEINTWHNARLHKEFVFIETAILYSSGLNDIVSAELRVEAPTEIRVKRVIKRNGLSEEHILSRIKAQECELNPQIPVSPLVIIYNDGKKAVIPQLISALKVIRQA